MNLLSRSLSVFAFFLVSVAHADPRAALAIIEPVQSCETLVDTRLDKVVGAAVTLSTKRVTTEKGDFCEVSGRIAPSIAFKLNLPTTKWTQRYLQAGCGGLCGTINASSGNAGACQPALNGEFAVAATDMGHSGAIDDADEGGFASDGQKRIDFAYRANHLTALASKALIRAFYGVAPRYAYFSGCSDGGREALMEAQRFPMTSTASRPVRPRCCSGSRTRSFMHGPSPPTATATASPYCLRASSPSCTRR